MIRKFLCKINLHSPCIRTERILILTGNGVQTCLSCRKYRYYILGMGEFYYQGGWRRG